MYIRTLCISGLTGSSKSTVAELIATCLADTPKPGKLRKVIARDTSGFLDRSRQKETACGRQLLEMEDARLAGKVLEAGPVIGSINENINWLAGLQDLEVLLLAGSPRTEPEALFFRQRQATRFVLIEATETQVAEAIDFRIKSGKMRADDGPHTLATKLQEYRNKILPAMAILPKDKVLRISRSMSLFERIEATVKHMYVDDTEQTIIPKYVHDKWLSKLHTRNHPIHAKIREIETGVSAQGSSKLCDKKGAPKHPAHPATPLPVGQLTSSFA